MNHYIRQYGKQTISDVIDILLINQQPLSPEKTREWLIKNDHIKKSSRANFRMIVQIGAHYKTLYVKNGRNQHVISVYLNERTLPQLLEELNNDTTTN